MVSITKSENGISKIVRDYRILNLHLINGEQIKTDNIDNWVR
jgi:hypothetical protein